MNVSIRNIVPIIAAALLLCIFIIPGICIEVASFHWQFVSDGKAILIICFTGFIVTVSVALYINNPALPEIDLPLIFVSILFALLLLLGQSLDATNSLTTLYLPFSNLLITFYRLAALAIFFFLVIRVLLLVIDQLFCWDDIAFARLPSWFFPLIIFVCWLPFFLVFFPGAIPTDTSRQLAQLFGTGNTILDNHFPFFTSLIFGGIYKLGMLFSDNGVVSVALLSIFQMILGACIFGTITEWVKRLGAPKWLVIFSACFFGLIPIIPAHAVTISKDYLHACIFALFALEILLYCRRTKEIDSGASLLTNPFMIGATALFLCLTRNNGVFIAIPAIGIIWLFLRRKDLIAVFVSVVVLFFHGS